MEGWWEVCRTLCCCIHLSTIHGAIIMLFLGVRTGRAAEDDEGTLAKRNVPPGVRILEVFRSRCGRERVRNLMRNCLISFGAQDQTRFVFPAIFQGLWRKQGWSSVFGVRCGPDGREVVNRTGRRPDWPDDSVFDATGWPMMSSAEHQQCSITCSITAEYGSAVEREERPPMS